LLVEATYRGLSRHDVAMSLYVVGAGGLGRETLDVALACGVAVTGFVDDARAGGCVRGVPVVAPYAVPRGSVFVVGIADPGARSRLTHLLAETGCAAGTLVHPRAVVAPEVDLGAGALVMAGAHVSSSVVTGRSCQVQYNATVGHDTTLQDFVTVLPGANVSGAVVLGRGCTVGSGAVVLQGRVVGAGAFVGAGAVVTRDVPEGQTVVGSPARPLSR
jgi:sugar O-acyltransferase (sialic acid O-acetyltransferase NeuD family)